MSYSDERIERQINRFGFAKEIIFLVLVISIIIYRILSGIDIVSVILLTISPIVSAVVLVKGIKKKRLSLSDVFNGIRTGDERILRIIDASGTKGYAFGAGVLLAYVFYGAARFSSMSVGLELLLWLLVCFDYVIETRFINKIYVAFTDNGPQQPYYDDNKKKKEIMNGIFKEWIKFALLFTVGDVLASANILRTSPISSLFKYIIMLPGEMIACLIFAVIDVLIAKYINKKVYDQIK